MSRVGIGMGYAPEMTIREMLKLVSEAERRNFEMVLFSETLMTFRDAISALSAFALNTSKIKLGCTQITRIRTPLVIAQTFATLDELSNGRMILSLGACTDSHAKKNGLQPQNPNQVLRDHVSLIKEYWANSGREVNFKGETIQIEGEGLGIRSMRQVPIWIAAQGKKALKMAGEIGDGVLLDSNASPDYVRNAVNIVKEGAESAGRDSKQIEVAGIIVSAVSNDETEAINAVRWEVARKFSPVGADFVRRRVKVGEPCVNEEMITELLKSFKEGGIQKLKQDIPERVIRELTAVGTAKEVQDRIDTYRRAGIQLPIIRPANQELLETTLNTLAP